MLNFVLPIIKALYNLRSSNDLKIMQLVPGIVINSHFYTQKKSLLQHPKMPVFMRLLTLFFDQKIRLWRCGELNSGLKGILIPFYHYSQLFNLIFSLIEQGEAGKRQTQIFYLTQQGFGFLLRSALLLAGVSSKVSYWLEKTTTRKLLQVQLS